MPKKSKKKEEKKNLIVKQIYQKQFANNVGL